jgi:hypothetical protein
MTNKEKEFCLDLLKLFKLDNEPFDKLATEKQIEIFYNLIFRKKNRIQILASTQYGKSLIVALSCIILSCLRGQLIAVIAPSKEKAKIIMRYYISHLGDSHLFYDKLEKNTKLERLRQEESKERIILRNGGGIFIVSANASDSIKGIQSAMGEGAKIVIQDESALIPDNIESTIFRMIAGHPDGFYCKIGNPFYRNHFLKSWQNPKYEKIFIDYEQALKEGRYTQEFIEEARKKPHFGILFECKFPRADMVDPRGFSTLLSDEDLTQKSIKPFGELRMGVDVAEGGGAFNVIVLRWANFAKVELKYISENTMDLVGRIVQTAKEHDILAQNIFIDALGVGKGACDRLREQRWAITEVKGSEKADDDTEFVNKRAENYWRTRLWLKQGGILKPNEDWLQLTNIKYKVRDSSGKMMLMSKDDMRKEGYESPDVADALALTFNRRGVLSRRRVLNKEERDILDQFDAFRDKPKTRGVEKYKIL